MPTERIEREPAPRDPAKLRKTAFVLLALALVGGIVVIIGYLLHTKKQNALGRPPYVGRLESNFAAVRHDRKAVDLAQLDGKVWLVTMLSLSHPEKSGESLRMMKLVAEKYAARTDLQFVCFTVDPDRDEPDKLAAFAAENGVGNDPRWWFLAAGKDPTRRYLKNKLKLGAVTEREEGGVPVLEFDSVLGVVDQNRNIRGRYDFQEALRVQGETRAALAEHPGELEKLRDEHRAAMEQNREAVQFLEGHLLRALDYVFGEKDGTIKQS